MRQFLRRDAHPLVQFVKYALAGGIATVTHVVAFQLAAWRLFPCLQEKDFLARWLNLDLPALSDAARATNSMVDNALAFVVSNGVCYVLNRLFVFTPGRHHRFIEIGLFYAVSGVSLILGSIVMGLLIREFGMRTDFAFGANLVTSLLINYGMRKFVVFKG